MANYNEEIAQAQVRLIEAMCKKSTALSQEQVAWTVYDIKYAGSPMNLDDQAETPEFKAIEAATEARKEASGAYEDARAALAAVVIKQTAR